MGHWIFGGEARRLGSVKMCVSQCKGNSTMMKSICRAFVLVDVLFFSVITWPLFYRLELPNILATTVHGSGALFPCALSPFQTRLRLTSFYMTCRSLSSCPQAFSMVQTGNPPEDSGHI